MKSFFKTYTLPFFVLIIGLVAYYVMFIKSNERYNHNAGFYSNSLESGVGESPLAQEFDLRESISGFFASIKQMLLNSNPNEYPKEESHAHFTQDTHYVLESTKIPSTQSAPQYAQNDLNPNPQTNQTSQNLQENPQTNAQNTQDNKDLASRWKEANQNAIDSFSRNTDKPAHIAYYASTRINVRKEPNINSPLVGRLLKGEEAKVIRINNEWAQLENGGWVSISLLTFDSSLEQSFSTEAQIYVSKANANIRQKPDNEASIAGHLFKNEKVRVLSVINGWAKLERGGYVALRLLDKEGE